MPSEVMVHNSTITFAELAELMKLDLVQWLRAQANLTALGRLNEAADEIERLRALKTNVDVEHLEWDY